MIAYIAKRLGQTALVLFFVSLIVFVMASRVGDPVLMILPPDATDAQKEFVRASLGLDRSLFVQYGIFLKNLCSGDLGTSYVTRRPALTLIFERMPATFEMVILSMVFSLLVAIPAGVYAGAHPKSFLSRFLMTGSLLGISLPPFWVGIMLIFIFSVLTGVLPSSGRGGTQLLWGVPWSFLTRDGLRHLLLPSVTLALGTVAMLMRLTRAQIVETMRLDYIRFARAKGVSRAVLLFSHALRNSLIPVVTVFGLQLGNLIAFATVTETIFAWPGMGKLLMDAINTSDRPVIVAYLMVVSVLFVAINFFVDLVYMMLDPRIDLTR